MSELVADCPRCKAQEMTFDLISEIKIFVRHDWQQWYEAFCICRSCSRSTIFVLSQSHPESRDLLRQNSLANLKCAANKVMEVEGHISLKDQISESPPDYLPAAIEASFREGAACLAIGCPNAAGTMFRLSVDLATKPLLPEENANGLNGTIRRSLGLRLKWLIEQGILSEALQDLSSCIKDDGNDGAHEGTLTEEDAADILDFTRILLERLFTEPKRIELARERRAARHPSK